MELSLEIKMNEKLFLRNPKDSALGKRIVQHSIILIHQIGYEAFTFKKLANKIKTTEAGIYRYFENKHRLLLYIVDWYWNWLEYQVIFQTKNFTDPKSKIRTVIGILAAPVVDDVKTSYVDERLLYEIVEKEGAKVYLTRHVVNDQEFELFKPYEDLCVRISEIISECNPHYQFPRSLSSTLIEMAHFQKFFLQNLPALTDIGSSKDENLVYRFLENLIFSSIRK
ncbi:MAG: TetR/AcrR family transcriptional regulator [Sphingobacteriaceae bacterium]